MKRGFTIVELLIVVVVIAILAAITITTFSGVTVRAENTKTVSAVNALVKSLTMYGETNDQYNSDVNACAGVSPCVKINTATNCFGLGGVSGSGALMTELSTISTTSFQPSKQQVTCSTGATYTGVMVRSYNTRKSATIYYFLKGDTADCAITGATRSVSGEAVLCLVALPNR